MPTTKLKPGTKTSEFWMVVLTNVFANTGTIDVGGSTERGLLLIASVVAYAIARGLAKIAAPKDEVIGGGDGLDAVSPEANLTGGMTPEQRADELSRLGGQGAGAGPVA
jgi:hypothetical protein